MTDEPRRFMQNRHGVNNLPIYEYLHKSQKSHIKHFIVIKLYKTVQNCWIFVTTSQMTQGTRRPYSEDEVKADVNVKMTELWLFLNC